MGILQLPMQVPGMVGVFPNQKFMVTTDDLTTITTPGYLNQVNLESNPVSSTDVLQVLYGFVQTTGIGIYGTFTVSINNGVITLLEVLVASGVRTWIPTFTFTTPGDLSVNYITRLGNYSRIGNIIFSNFQLGFIPTFTTSSGQAMIDGGPLASPGSYFVGTVNCAGVTLTASYTFYTLTINTGESGSAPVIYLTEAGPSQNSASITASNFTSGTPTSLYGTIMYYSA